MSAHEEDDKLHFHMAIDKVAQLSDTNAVLCHRIAALEGKKSIPFTFKVKDWKEGGGCSRSFYTSLKGYHMRIEVYAALESGADSMHGVSVFVYHIKGDNDTNLSWPLKAEVKVTLLNQLEDQNHFSKTIVYNSSEDLFAEVWLLGANFIPRSELGYNSVKKTLYLKDDTLYFRVLVKEANNWLRCTDH